MGTSDKYQEYERERRAHADHGYDLINFPSYSDWLMEESMIEEYEAHHG